MKLLLSFIAAITGVPFTVRGFTRDTAMAFQFRMGSGFPGDVNRTHPVTIEPCLIDDDTPPLIYGQAIITDAAEGSVRPLAAGDGAITKIWGTLVRPYPTQQTTASAANAKADFGSATPPTSGVVDVMRSGYMIVKIPAAEAALALKGSAVFVRVAAAGADDPVGGFKAQADGGNTAALDTNLYTFNGPADASGNAEVCINI